MTGKKAEKLARLSAAADALAPKIEDQQVLLKELSEQQQLIARLKLRGMSQKAIANVLDVTPQRISQEVRTIREHFRARGASVNQEVVVGETVTLYEEVERKAWEVFNDKDNPKKLRALDTVMSAREKHLKLLMDLGLMKRAAIEHQHGIAKSPVFESLTPEKRQEIVARIIEQPTGAAPTPPDDEDLDDEYSEAD